MPDVVVGRLTNNTETNKIQYFYFMPVINENYIQFFTAVCTDWLPILKNDECKDVIIRSLKYRVQTKEVGVAGFVIMPNHIHIIWRMRVETARENLQRDFLKITAKQIIDIFQRNEPEMIRNITVNLKDRKLQVWKRNSMRIDLHNEKFLLQKLNYIHNNPCHPKWELATHPCNYLYSSAQFHYNRENSFEILQHYADV
jgi:REP element-mobilizing transposase RayT